MTTLATLAAFVRRDWTVARSYRLTFALNIATTLFSLTLFFYLSRLIDDTSVGAGGQALESGFFPFVVIGLALLQIVQTAIMTFAAKVRQEQTTGTLEALLVMPTSPAVIVLSSAAYDLIRAFLQALVMIGLAALIFGLRFDTGILGVSVAVAALAATVPLFAALGIAVAAFTVAFKQALGITGLITVALSLLGGVYFPIAVLPAGLEAVGRALPFTWALDVLRAALLRGEIETAPLAGLAVSAPVALAGALVVFRLAVDRARADGSLTQY